MCAGRLSDTTASLEDHRAYVKTDEVVAKISLAEWWLWNQIPVTVGNVVGGFLFTGLPLHITHHRRNATR